MLLKNKPLMIGVMAVIALLITGAVYFFVIRDNDSATDTDANNQEETNPNETTGDPDSKFEVIEIEFTPGNNHIIAVLDIINYEPDPVMIQCQYVVSAKSGGGGFAGDLRSYTLQPGQNDFSDEIFSQPQGGPPGLTGADLVDDFNNLHFGISNGINGRCKLIFVLKDFNADTSSIAIEVLYYDPADLLDDFGELRYRAASPETCSYRLESSARSRISINPEAWSDYGSNHPNGVIFDGVFHTHILARDCGKWQRVNDLQT